MIRRFILLSILLLLTSCGKVSTGAQGPAGQPGLTGAQGPTGPTGPTGTIGSPIQLCSACVPSYPNVFPESVVCINNNLYGVYSANDGFLSILPPGAYSSDGINCTCTVTIEPNCIVSQ